MDTAEYTIHEGYGIEVYAEVSYTIADASGDGYHEPHEPAHVEIRSVKLFKRTSRKVPTYYAGRYAGFNTVYTVTDLGEAPEWVDDVIAADEDWQNDLIANECFDDGQPDKRQEWADYDAPC